MSRWYVKATVRDSVCRISQIVALVVQHPDHGTQVVSLEKLKPLADRGQLWISIAFGASSRSALVEIYFSPLLSRWVALTQADCALSENLKALPMTFRSAHPSENRFLEITR